MSVADVVAAKIWGEKIISAFVTTDSDDGVIRDDISGMAKAVVRVDLLLLLILLPLLRE